MDSVDEEVVGFDCEALVVVAVLEPMVAAVRSVAKIGADAGVYRSRSVKAQATAIVGANAVNALEYCTVLLLITTVGNPLDAGVLPNVASQLEASCKYAMPLHTEPCQ